MESFRGVEDKNALAGDRRNLDIIEQSPALSKEDVNRTSSPLAFFTGVGPEGKKGLAGPWCGV